MTIAGLILAAGSSSRMKTTKQLLPWGPHTLLQHVSQTVLQSDVDVVYLVLGANADQIKQRTKLSGITLVENNRWREGLGASITEGIDVISKRSEIDACLILLADQPFIETDYLNRMLEVYDPERIIASDYQGRAGVPCLFPRKYFPELLRLEGDNGAGKLLHDLNKHVLILEAPVDLRDIDTYEAYQKYLPK